MENIYIKRENINTDISENVAMNILNQENNVLWSELKTLNHGLTVLIDEYNSVKHSQR